MHNLIVMATLLPVPVVVAWLPSLGLARLVVLLFTRKNIVHISTKKI